MRSIEVKFWEVKDNEGKIHTEDTLMLLSILVTNKKPEELPRGLEQFRLFTKITKAFEKANDTKVLALEEDVYKFLKNIIEKDIPSIWGTNARIVEAINIFIDAKEE